MPSQKYQAKVVSKGDLRYAATTQKGAFAMAADGSASGAIDTLLASLCACLAHYTGDFLQQEGAPFSQYEISAESELAEGGRRLGPIRTAVELEGGALSDAQKAALSEYVTRCPIHGSLKANSPISLEIRP